MFKRVLSAILIFSVLFAVLPVNIAFAEESQTTEISNQYIKIVVNNKNGGYVISTLEGDILKKSDNNVSLTHRGENYDTSFTSFKIGNDEYVFGEKYGLFTKNSTDVITKRDENGNFIKSVWSVDNFEIEQNISLVNNDTSEQLGTAMITYTVRNKSSNGKSIKSRILIDSQLGENDYGYYEVPKQKLGQGYEYFEFEKTNDYSFITKLWSIAKSFIQFLCYRQNVGLPEAIISAPIENGKHGSVATFYVVGETNTVEPNTLDKGRYIKQQYIAGYEGEILNDISSNNLYQRHIPLSYKQGCSIDAARFVMITAAFEWEFNRTYPNGVPKKASTIEAENTATIEIEKLINSSSRKLKKIYRYLKKQIKNDSLQSEIERVGKDYADIIDMFGNHLYQINNETLKYSEMGERLSAQRNHFAHGDLDKDFIGNSLLDLIFLEYVIYTIQLKQYGIPDDNIKKIINDLFCCYIDL